MEQCHQKIAQILDNTHIAELDSSDFMLNHIPNIKQQLRKFCRLLEGYIDKSLGTSINDAIPAIQAAGHVFAVFFQVLDTYVNDSDCSTERENLAGIMVKFLCKKHEKYNTLNFDILYHLMTTYALLLVDCAFIYWNNSQRSGISSQDIDISQVIAKPYHISYRIRKDQTKQCIEALPVGVALDVLLSVRQLFGLSISARRNIARYCKKEIDSRNKRLDRQAESHEEFLIHLQQLYTLVNTKIKTKQ